MQYYEAYEDVLDEDYGDDYDDAYDDAYDDSFDDAFDENDGEDFGEARKSRSQRRAARARRRQNRRDKRHERRHGKPQAPTKPAATGDVKAAFNNVGQDLNKVNRDLQREKARQANEQINDLIALYLFRPRLVPKTVDKKVIVPIASLSLNAPTDASILAASTAFITALGKTVKFATDATKPELLAAELSAALAVATKAAVGSTTKTVEVEITVPTIEYTLEDNLIPQIAVKLLSNMKGLDASKGFERYIPLIAGIALSPSAQKELKISDGTSTGTGLLNDLTKKPVLLLGLLLLVINWGKLTKK